MAKVAGILPSLDSVETGGKDLLNKIVAGVKGYHPLDPNEAISTGAPIAAGVGGLIGAGIGAAHTPGYDSTGHKKSRLSSAIEGLLAGAGLGAGAALAAPTIGQAALTDAGRARSAEISQGTPDGGILQSLAKPLLHGENAINTASSKVFAHNLTLQDLLGGRSS